MKTFIIIFLLIFLINAGFAQKVKTITVARVKEKAVVDTFIDTYLTKKSRPEHAISSTIIITIRTGNKGSLFGVLFADSLIDKAIYINKDFILKKDNFRYFKYKNYSVFICGDVDAYGFFKLTRDKKTFTLKVVYNEKKSNDSNYGFGYVFENGHFQPLVPPTR